MSANEDYYAILGVEPTTTQAAIKRAYRQLALRYHPDKNREVGAAATFQRVAAAYEVLSCEHSRREYDRSGGGGLFAQWGRAHGSGDGNGASRFTDPAELFRQTFGEFVDFEDTSFVARVAPDRVFNLPLFEGYLVIDTRPAHTFERSCITGSFSFPPHAGGSEGEGESEAQKVGRLEQLFVALTREIGLPDSGTPIVLVGGAASSSGAGAGAGAEQDEPHLEWLAAQLQVYHQDCPATAPAAHSEDGNAREGAGEGHKRKQRDDGADGDDDDHDARAKRDWWAWLGAAFAHRADSRIWVVDGGFEAFRRLYPGLTGPADKTDVFWGGGGRRPSPHHIAGRMFLGSRAVQLDAQTLADYGISHLVLATPPGAQAEQAQAKAQLEAQLPGATIHWCSVVDAGTSGDGQQAHSCWLDAAAFMAGALSAGGTAMVLLHGRSVSASVVVAWLVLEQCMEVEAAANLVRRQCKSVDWNLTCPDELLALGARGCNGARIEYQ